MSAQTPNRMFDVLVESRAALPNAPLGFHRTTRRNAENIVQSGFDPNHADHSEKHDETFLANVADDLGVSMTVDRTESVFFSLSLPDTNVNNLLASERVVAVDLTELTNPMAVADVHRYDSVISYTPRDTERACSGPYREEERAVARQYLESMRPVTTVEGGLSWETSGKPELIVEGAVPAEAICGVISGPLD